MAAAVAAGFVLGAAACGLAAARWAQRPAPSRRRRRRAAGASAPAAADDDGSEEEGEEDESDESDDDAALASARGPHKMVLVVRTDLKMTKGKIAAQCCHGAIGAYELAAELSPEALRRWERSGCAKVALQVSTEAELLAVHRAARAKRLPHYLVVDAGRTQVEAGSRTVCAVGPAHVDAVDAVTGALRLL